MTEERNERDGVLKARCSESEVKKVFQEGEIDQVLDRSRKIRTEK